MKYYISDIIPKFQRFSRKLDEKSLIQNFHWIAFNENLTDRTTYIFRDNSDLIISENGQVKKAKWEYIGNQTILIENAAEALLYKNSFLDETLLVLNLHNTNTYAFFLNETKIGASFKSVNSINEYLDKKYNLTKEQNPNPKSFKDFDEITHTEGNMEDKYELAWGKYQEMTISFSDGTEGKIFKGGKSEKFFYMDNMRGSVYCKDKADCIYQLYLHLSNQI